MNPFSEGDVKAFLEEQTTLPFAAEFADEPAPSDAPLIEQCFCQLTRPAFRRTRIDEESAADLRRKLSKSIASREPISLTVPFGGYKNYRAPSFPGPDWAEVFNMNYLARYLMPIARSYEPGVVLQYTHSSGVIDLVSNVPLSASAAYMGQFRSLLAIFAAHLPKNLRLNDVDITSHYPPGEQMTELRNNYEYNRIHWASKLSEPEQERRVASAQRNLMRDGVVDLSSLSEGEWQKRCVDAAMWCEALDSLTKRRQFNKYSDGIQLVFVRGPGLSIHVGSCDMSANHFWSGCGVLEPRKHLLQQRIVSGEKLSTFRREGIVRDVVADSVFSCVGPGFNSIAIAMVEGSGVAL